MLMLETSESGDIGKQRQTNIKWGLTTLTSPNLKV